ncbi:MAG: ATP-dependent DNA helicase [Blautia sp.]|nr:ATP-dependent DNA helicase [Blautia sp.]
MGSVEQNKTEIRISVRNLVEFILREGDLDSRRGALDKESMQKGSRLHRKIQKSMGSGYQAEVSLKRKTEYEELDIIVEGRADGIFEKDGCTFVDEIKGSHKAPSRIVSPTLVHRGQAMCYAYIYAQERRLDRIGVQITYVDLDTEEVRYFPEILSFPELKEWYDSILDSYYKWVSYLTKWREVRNLSAQKIAFPFPYREGQRKMVGSVYHAIANHKQIFVQAPTGVGKTMSTVFPAVRSVGEGKADMLFYLTAKTITRTVAQEAFSILQTGGLLWKVLTITAKEKLCFCEKTECNPEACPYAKGHFDRINEAVYELWTTGNCYDRETLLSHADKWKVCPFEMSLDLSLWVDAVICDYNYVFDPNVCLKRFFADGVKGNYIFLIDEAHNLVDRAREMYSASICKEEVLRIRNIMKFYSPRVTKALNKVNRQLLELKKECGRYEVLAGPGGLPVSLLALQGELDHFMEESQNVAVTEQILDFYFSVRDFLNVSELLDENYVVYSEHKDDGEFRLNLMCVNPAVNLAQRLEKGVGTAFFSATLLPMTYYRKMLSVRTDDFGIYVQSPFDREKRCLVVGRDVSSRYTRRGYEEYHKIAGYLAQCVWQKKGHYMVFFPSYKMLEDVYAIYETEFSADWVKCIRQTPSMQEREREEFLEEFEKDENTLLGFCIMGGIFSEGIDLIGNRLIGAIIVGTGLPQVSVEKEILKNYYDKKGENGFDYAYRYAGMNKVLQAAGRVIRTRNDEGVILLLDERFLNKEYEDSFPVEWSDRVVCRIGQVEEVLRDFWDRQENNP